MADIVYSLPRCPRRGFFEAFMNPILQYIHEAVEELHQVRWPTQRQAVRLSVVVLGFCAASAAVLGFIDFILSEAVNILIVVT